MVDDFAERIAAIAAQKQAEQDKAAKDAIEMHSDLRVEREQIALVVDKWNKFIVPTVNTKIAVTNKALQSFGLEFDVTQTTTRTMGPQVVLQETPTITVQPVPVGPRVTHVENTDYRLTFTMDDTGDIVCHRNPPPDRRLPVGKVVDVTEEALGCAIVDFVEVVTSNK